MTLADARMRGLAPQTLCGGGSNNSRRECAIVIVDLQASEALKKRNQDREWFG
jgi:hypothetical protein